MSGSSGSCLRGILLIDWYILSEKLRVQQSWMRRFNASSLVSPGETTDYTGLEVHSVGTGSTHFWYPLVLDVRACKLAVQIKLTNLCQDL
jgi:hypothetical protein